MEKGQRLFYNPKKKLYKFYAYYKNGRLHLESKEIIHNKKHADQFTSKAAPKPGVKGYSTSHNASPLPKG